MGLFDAGKANSVTTPGAPSPADVAGKLFAIKILLSQLQQGGGAPQTLGEYIKSGPRRVPSSVTGQGGDALMAALSQPGAFNRGPTNQQYQPSSPSTFQDLAGLLGLGLAGYGAYQNSGAPKENAMDSLLKLYLMKQMGINVGGAGGGLGGAASAASGLGSNNGFSLSGGNSAGMIPSYSTDLGISPAINSGNYSVGGAGGDYGLPTLSASDYLFGQSLGAY